MHVAKAALGRERKLTATVFRLGHGAIDIKYRFFHYIVTNYFKDDSFSIVNATLQLRVDAR